MSPLYFDALMYAGELTTSAMKVSIFFATGSTFKWRSIPKSGDRPFN